MILQYLFVLTLFCDVTKTQERNSDVISGVVDALPESLQALLHSDDVSTDFDDDETREYIRSLKDVFRFANLGNTPISEVFEAGGFPFELGEIGQLSVDDVIQIMVNNMKDTNRPEADRSRVKRQIIDDILDRDQPQLRSSIDPECKKDYDALALPLTNGLLRRAGEIVLTELFADSDTQEVFCNLACERLCEIFLPIPPCINNCLDTCNTTPFNRTLEIEALLDFFIEDIEPYGWGRRSRHSNSSLF